MPKRNIWLVFYALVSAGGIYIALIIASTWQSLQERTDNELSTVNRIFASSLNSSFDQQEIMLDLLGKELLRRDLYLDRERATALLDSLLVRNKALVGFGLADPDGKLIASSSSIDLDRMPNLKNHVNSRETFIRALERHDMVMGDTYYLPVVESWVIPFRKSIRDPDDQVIGVMTTGIKPDSLIPRLHSQSGNLLPGHIPLMLIHDESFRYAYVSAVRDNDMMRELVNQPVPREVLESHRQALEQRTGLQMNDLREGLQSAEYEASSQDGNRYSYSLLYIPKYRLWSIAFLPQQQLIGQLVRYSIYYLAGFIIAVIVLFLLVRHIHRFEQRRHRQLLDLANHDFLTGLNNRLYLQAAEQEWINETPGVSASFSSTWIISRTSTTAMVIRSATRSSNRSQTAC